MKFLKPEHMLLLNQSCADIDGMIRLTERIHDPEQRENIVRKLADAKDTLAAQYGEFEQEDGSLLVKHPAFCLIYIDEDLLDEPVKLFFAKTKALSSIKISVYRADARVLPNGNVTYERREQLAGVELTQEVFSKWITISGSDRFPATIRNFAGQNLSYPGDASEQSSRMLMDAAYKVPDGFEKWGQDILNIVSARAAKGGAMSKSARDEIRNTSSTLESWMASNPNFYARELAKHVTQVANNIEMEVVAASKLKGEK
jgi:hypothetical protein